MFVKKAGGRVIGAELTVAERKAMNIEIQKDLAEFNRKNAIEIDALFIWWLRRKLGFGPKRLKEFYLDFSEAFEALIAHYEMPKTEGVWLCTEQLKEEGIDIEEWVKESEQCEKERAPKEYRAILRSDGVRSHEEDGRGRASLSQTTSFDLQHM